MSVTAARMISRPRKLPDMIEPVVVSHSQRRCKSLLTDYAVAFALATNKRIAVMTTDPDTLARRLESYHPELECEIGMDCVIPKWKDHAA